MKDGFQVVGIFRGVRSEPWSRNGKTGVNHRAGITRTYVDNYGMEASDTINVDLAPDFLSRIQPLVNELVGKRVSLSVLPTARAGGKQGAWLSVFAPRDAELVELKGTK